MTSGRPTIGTSDRPEGSIDRRPPSDVIEQGLALPGRPFILAAGAVLLVSAGWGVYLLSDRLALLGLQLALTALLIALAFRWEQRLSVAGAAGEVPWFVRSRAMLAIVLSVLVAGLLYRALEWPHLVWAGDSPDYDRAAAAWALQHQFTLVPWRTAGYPFTLSWIYDAAGALRYQAVLAFQLVLSLLTAVLMAATAYLATGRRLAALIALALGCFLYPIAAASGNLMTEGQAMFLASLVALLVLVLHSGRSVGAAALVLGPALGLMYETRPPMLPWALVAGAIALLLPRLRHRWRVVIVAGAALTLLPVAVANLEGPAHVATPSAVLDLLPQALGTDRFSIYWNYPASPALIETFREAILTDGAAAEYWSGWPAQQATAIMAQRRTVMVAYVWTHRTAFVELVLRRAPLMYRYDQYPDMTYDPRFSAAWLVVVDVLLALAAVGVGRLALDRAWVPAALLGGLVGVYSLVVALIHVEPRYSLPSLPTVAVLAAVGSSALARSALGAVRGRDPRRLAISAGVVSSILLVVMAMEVWLWPGLVDNGVARPRTGAYQVASCSQAPHMLASIAWQPGTSRVLAGGVGGVASWDVKGRTCGWKDLLLSDIWDLSFSPDGRRVALATYAARVVDSRTLRPVPGPVAANYMTGSGADVLGVSFDPSGRWLALTAPAFAFVVVYDTESRQAVHVLRPDGRPIGVRWSPAGDLIAVSTARGVVHLYDPQVRLVQDLQVGRQVQALAWSPSGDRLAAGDDSGAIYVWAVDGHGRQGSPAVPLTSTQAHRAAVRNLAFSPDGKLLASASSDLRAGIWSAADLRSQRWLIGHTATVWGVAWSPQGDQVVTAAADGTLKLWAAT